MILLRAGNSMLFVDSHMSNNIVVVCCFISSYSLTYLVISNFLISYVESSAIETTINQNTNHTIQVQTNQTNYFIGNVSLSEINKRQNNDSTHPKIENEGINKQEIDSTTKDNYVSQTSTTEKLSEAAIKQKNLTNFHSNATEILLTANNKTLEAFSIENLDNKTTLTNNTTLKNNQILDENNNQTINFPDKNSTSTTSTLHSSNFIPETSVSIELNHGENPDEEKENNLPDDPNQVEKDTEVNESDKSGSEIEQNGAENTFDEQPIVDQTEKIEQNKNPKDDSSSQKLPENNKNPFLPAADDFDEESSIGFLTYFLIISTICVLFYVVYHKRAKIIALIIEGRSNGQRRRRVVESRVYNRLENVQDAMPNA